MNSNWAADNLQVIRTLMERSALYRRALAPILIWLGVVGTMAGIAGPLVADPSEREFVVYWGIIGVVSLAGCFYLARKQAIKDDEPFWSAPTRHVSQALLPPFLAGAMAGATALISPHSNFGAMLCTLLPAVWMVLYGCALTSAGFFMRKGMRVLGYVFLVLGCAALAAVATVKGLLQIESEHAHYIMGGSFGLLHLAAGIYIRASKENGNAQ